MKSWFTRARRPALLAAVLVVALLAVLIGGLQAQQAGSIAMWVSGGAATAVSAAAPLPVTSVGTAAGTGGATAQSVQGVAGGVPVGTKGGNVTLVALAVSTVTTGGTAVTALSAGQRSAGGFLYNPSTATIALCINEISAASGTASQGSLTCIPPDRTYNLSPSGNAVSVVSSDSAHPFSGFGFQ